MTNNSDVFITTEGIAILFSGDPDTGAWSMDVFRESDEFSGPMKDLDPFHRAQALQESTEDDFPNRLWTVAVNDRGRELMKNARMRAMGFEGYED